jgi:hypothetical protein
MQCMPVALLHPVVNRRVARRHRRTRSGLSRRVDDGFAQRCRPSRRLDDSVGTRAGMHRRLHDGFAQPAQVSCRLRDPVTTDRRPECCVYL